MKLHDCDICDAPGIEARYMWVAAKYTGRWQAPFICNNCGFVFARERRSSAEIAEDWKRIYAEKLYDPTWPGVKARLYYVAEWIDQNIGWTGKRLLDIGGGRGTFALLAGEAIGTRRLAETFDPAFGDQTVEDFEPTEKFDIVTILWTLENCGNANAMIAKARECLKPDGHLVVATGSRIMVPFRKPMSAYFSTQPQDLHAFRWSANSLGNIMERHAFGRLKYNDYQQNDVLLVCGSPRSQPYKRGQFPDEQARLVENHFIDWYRSFP